MNEEFKNDMLQQGLQREMLRNRADAAAKEGKFLKLKGHKDFVISPVHFMLLVEEGRFRGTKPGDWVLCAPNKTDRDEIRNRHVDVARKASMRLKGEGQGMGTTENKATWGGVKASPEKLLQLLKQRETVQARMEALTQTINETARALGIGGMQVAAVPAPQAPAPKPFEVANGPSPNRHRRYGRNRANGISIVLTKDILANGPSTTNDVIKRTLSDKFTQRKITQNLTNLKLIGILQYNEGTKQWALAKGWDQTHTGRKVAAEVSPALVGAGA